MNEVGYVVAFLTMSPIAASIFTGAWVDSMLITDAGKEPPNSVWATNVTFIIITLRRQIYPSKKGYLALPRRDERTDNRGAESRTQLHRYGCASWEWLDEVAADLNKASYVSCEECPW